MLIQQPCSFFNLCSCSCLPWATPRLCCCAPVPVKFPTPLHLRLHCPVFPISGLFQSGASPLSTGLGVLDMVWSTWSTTESHRKMTVRERLTVGMHHAHGCNACNGTRRGQRGQGTTSIGSILYVERLTAGYTAAARKCLLITRKIMIPSPDNRDPLDGPPYFAKKNVSP